MQDIFYPSEDGKTTIHACVWRPDGVPKAVVQIVHGMAEYAERYARFAKFLNEAGYIVCAADHLGHGKSVVDKQKLGYFAEECGYNVLISDIRRLYLLMKEKEGDLPYFMIGHSMGSFLLRNYIARFGGELDGAVCMGTGYISAATTGAAKFLTKLVAAFKGWEHRSEFINNLAFGAYNKKFEGRTQFDWLSKKSANVDEYIADDLCGVPFTCNGFYGLFSAISDACKSKTIKAAPKTLPLFFVAGKDDPVGNYSKGVIKTYDKYISSGVERADMTIYPDVRHEILNDDCAEQVMSDVLKFLDREIAGQS